MKRIELREVWDGLRIVFLGDEKKKKTLTGHSARKRVILRLIELVTRDKKPIKEGAYKSAGWSRAWHSKVVREWPYKVYEIDDEMYNLLKFLVFRTDLGTRRRKQFEELLKAGEEEFLRGLKKLAICESIGTR